MLRPALTSQSLVVVVAGIVSLCAGVYLLFQVYNDYRLLGNLVPTQQATAQAADAEPAFSLTSLINARLFGDSDKQQAVARREAEEEAPETRLSLELKGVFSSTQAQSSTALIAERGKPASYYRIGEQLPGGATLDRVATNHVELLRNGRRERLSFSPPGTSSGPVAVDTRQDPPPVFTETADPMGERRVESLRERLRQLRDAQRDLTEE